MHFSTAKKTLNTPEGENQSQSNIFFFYLAKMHLLGTFCRDETFKFSVAQYCYVKHTKNRVMSLWSFFRISDINKISLEKDLG